MKNYILNHLNWYFFICSRAISRENENNLIINAGFEDNPSWGDEFSIGWRGYNCNRIGDKGVLFANEWYKHFSTISFWRWFCIYLGC